MNEGENELDTKTRKQRRQLTRAEDFKLCSWYKDNADRLLKISDPQTCELAEKEIGVGGLNASHIVGVRAALDLQKPRLSRSGGSSEDVKALEGLLNLQAEELNTVKRQMQGLLDRVRKLEAQR